MNPDRAELRYLRDILGLSRREIREHFACIRGDGDTRSWWRRMVSPLPRYQ